MSGASVVRGVIVFFIVWPERFVRLEFYLTCVNATEPTFVYSSIQSWLHGSEPPPRVLVRSGSAQSCSKYGASDKTSRKSIFTIEICRKDTLVYRFNTFACRTVIEVRQEVGWVCSRIVAFLKNRANLNFEFDKHFLTALNNT